MSPHIEHYGVKSLAIFYYHDALIKMMKKVKFEPSVKLLQMYCQCNPGYNILNGSTELEQQYLLKQHEKYLEGFYKFSMLNRVCEIVQNYLNKTVSAQSNSFDKKIENPFLLKNLNVDSLQVNVPIMVLQEQEEIIGRFCSFFNKNMLMVEDQMGEQFDNLVGNMFLSFSVCIDSDMNSHKFDNLVSLPPEYYHTMIKWLIEHVDDCTSNNLRDNNRFYHVLSTFVFMHHIQHLIGVPIEFSSSARKNSSLMLRENITSMLDPMIFFKDNKNRYEAHGYFWGYEDQKEPISVNFTEWYNKMSYYGNLTECECICSKKGILPYRTSQKYDNKKIVSFLTMQEIFYSTSGSNSHHDLACKPN